MGELTKEYWKAFDEYNELKFRFVAKRALKDAPTLAAEIDTDVLTGKISANGIMGPISYDILIKPTNGRKFVTEMFVTYNLQEELPQDTEHITRHILTAQIMEKKLKNALDPSVTCSPYITKKNGKELISITCSTALGENEEPPKYDTLEQAAETVTKALNEIPKLLDPEKIFYKTWNTWRDIYINLPKEKAREELERLEKQVQEAMQ